MHATMKVFPRENSTGIIMNSCFMPLDVSSEFAVRCTVGSARLCCRYLLGSLRRFMYGRLYFNCCVEMSRAEGAGEFVISRHMLKFFKYLYIIYCEDRTIKCIIIIVNE